MKTERMVCTLEVGIGWRASNFFPIPLVVIGLDGSKKYLPTYTISRSDNDRVILC